MDEQKIRQIVAIYANRLPLASIDPLVARIQSKGMDENTLQITLSQLKDPTISLLISIFAGTLGVDRFLLNDIGLGVGKLLTGGGCGIWWLIDLFLIMDATKQKNYESLLMQL